MKKQIFIKLNKYRRDEINVATRNLEYNDDITTIRRSEWFPNQKSVTTESTIQNESIANSELPSYLSRNEKKCIIFAGERSDLYEFDLHVFPPEETLFIGDFGYGDVEDYSSHFPHRKQIAYFYDAPLLSLAQSFESDLMYNYVKENKIQNNSQSAEELKTLLHSIYPSLNGEKPINSDDIEFKFSQSFINEFEKYKFIIFFLHRYSAKEFGQLFSLMSDHRILTNIDNFNIVCIGVPSECLVSHICNNIFTSL